MRYFLLGEDVNASPSPAMMNAAFEATGVEATYEAISVRREDFRTTFLSLRDETGGMNLTIPFKSEVLPLLDHLDEVSSRISAVNVVKRSGSRYLGYNSDVNGITASLRDHGVERVGHALLVGAGGAARAFCEAMSQMGCRKVTVAVREKAKGKTFIDEMARVFPLISFDTATFEALGPIVADLIFNATPIGSRGAPLPDELKRVIYGHATVFDAVYRPMKTELLRIAEEKGSRIVYGYEMLLNQGTLAFEIWTGRESPKEIMRTTLRTALEGGS